MDDPYTVRVKNGAIEIESIEVYAMGEGYIGYCVTLKDRHAEVQAILSEERGREDLPWEQVLYLTDNKHEGSIVCFQADEDRQGWTWHADLRWGIVWVSAHQGGSRKKFDPVVQERYREAMHEDEIVNEGYRNGGYWD